MESSPALAHGIGINQLRNWCAAAEQAKADRMELLYQRSGRGCRNHPLNGLFTGLIAEAPSARVTLGGVTPATACVDLTQQPTDSHPTPTEHREPSA